MKKLTFIILTAALGYQAGAQTLDRSQRPKPGPAPEVKLGKSQSFTLPNGLRVFVVENHKLPTVAYSIQLDVRPALENDQAGYRDMMSELLTAGTKTRNKEQLNSEIDFIGARISASDESVQGASLKKHQNKLLELMSDIVLNAQFSQEELDKVKKRTLSALEAGRNNPDVMLANATAAITYGPQHPYGQVATDKTVDNITLSSIQNYYNTYFRPNVAYMAVVGDITIAEVKPLIEKYFGKWQKANVPVTAYSLPKPPAATQVQFIPRDAAVQSVINITYPIDLKPGDKDVIAARVANTILGGGSIGRLFLNLRERHGWTYGSYSSIDPDVLVGNFTAYAKARNAVSDSSVGEMLSEMRRIQNEPLHRDSLQSYLTYLSGGFAIGLEDPARVAQYAINIERYKMPKDYYTNYLKNLAAITPADVQRVARKYVNPAQAHIIVVGSKDVAEKLLPFDQDGKLAYYDNYGQPIKPAETRSVDASMTASQVIGKYVAAIGGEKALNALRDLKTVSEGEIQGTRLTITQMKRMPAAMKVTVQAMGMTLQKVVVNGDKGYEEAQGQRADMDAAKLADMKKEIDFTADLNPAKYGISHKLRGIEQVNGSDAYVIEVSSAGGKTLTQYYDVASGLLVKEVRNEETPQGPMSMTYEYSDYREVPGTNGYKIPYTTKQSVGPMTITATVTEVAANKGIADTEFQ